jgi:hypothetical protein
VGRTSDPWPRQAAALADCRAQHYCYGPKAGPPTVSFLQFLFRII